MNTFPIQIATPDGLLFSGNIERVKCRTVTGDMAVLAGHCNFCTALGMGEAYIRLEDGTTRYAACIGGMLSVMDGACHLLATTWEWKEDIDEQRALSAKERAEARLSEEHLSERDQHIAEAKLRRALVRFKSLHNFAGYAFALFRVPFVSAAIQLSVGLADVVKQCRKPYAFIRVHKRS